MGWFAVSPISRARRKLLRLDDEFTSRGKDEDRDPAGVAQHYRALRDQLSDEALKVLTGAHEHHRDELDRILRERIETLEQKADPFG